jgi:hypothetical protein
MWKLIPILLASSFATIVQAQTITDPDQIASKLHFWSNESGDPVYYGEVRNVDRRTMSPTTHYQCLALAFIKYEAGVFQYAHKMWAKSPDGSCHYEDVTSRKVGNHGICVRDSNAGFGPAIGTARMTKDNIDYAHSIFRAVDTRTRRVGEVAACVPPRGAGAGLYAIRIESGRFKVITTRPLDYEVSIEPQDPRKPPTKPVF